MPAPPPILLEDATLATLRGDDAGLVEDGALLLSDGHVGWAGPAADLPRPLPDGTRRHRVNGRLVTPGLIDCHTHLVYGGDRAAEFELRLEGASYEEIARAGGGIVSTVRATRAATTAELTSLALGRLDALRADGVTTVEIKSGYGLDRDTELRCLQVARSLPEQRPVSVLTTYLGAHALPPEFADDRQGYLDLVVDEVLPAVHRAGLADAVDAFCEGIAFTVDEVRRVFRRALELGLPVKLHAEQLSNLGGAAMAAGLGALSADHLEYLDDDGVAAMAAAGTVAVLLPGAFYTLGETRRPPVAALRAAGVPLAVATDLNPGSSPVHSLLTAMNMACVLFGLTPTEVLRGVTVEAARALGLEDRGVLQAGRRADAVVWDVESPAGLCYPVGHRPCRAVIVGGALAEGSLP